MLMTGSGDAPSDPHRKISILGSTGSIGCNTVDLIRRWPDRFSVEAITAHRNVARLAEQARLLNASLAVVADPTCYTALREALAGSGIAVAAGPEAVIEAALRPAELVMAAIVGAAGLAPTLSAVRRGAIVALANKECLVCAGELMTAEIDRCGATLIPVDSEHSAIFQVFDFDHPETVDSIQLTASGGPFRTLDAAAFEQVTPAQAVAHPNWSMGAKISVDSATMMNKGLEMIEAFHLFPIRSEQIEIVVHPQSVIHSLVSYVDGSVLAQLGLPDMRTPIALALGWPTRLDLPLPRLRLSEIAALTFEAPDPQRFPALRLARAALEAGGAAPAVLNAANEVAVESFLAGAIRFTDIPRVVEMTLEKLAAERPQTLDAVIAIDREARLWSNRTIAERCRAAVSVG